ncbi:hypothetical protein N0V93_000912 [Gnomoniopsis smithogilvyi]|uniref:RanBD1 domain-containing protein n=1 Tax=Gnomoniopsis smithogilvyi TaxID=1191159 RepID=A0A9W8Z2K6_9PEZI|nr:hypothetical protein N0V93_000912 [Gnomoniopsis smithogilvyi]
MEASTRQRAQGRPGTESTHRSFSSLTNWGVASRLSREDLKDAGNTPPRAMGSWKTTGPVGNARPAASSVMAGRKLFNRSQNPSRAGVNTTRSFSDMPMNTPGRVFASSSFRSGLSNGNNNKFTFSPRVPHNTVRESFPTVTPGRSFRGTSADMSGRGMSKASATNLFQMRITSPPPELSGEALTKQVPDNPNRVGSIYADEFLSHLVPPELDDLQRRQFLCILDLRRLKYASNEIFVKKDWRVNIMNFAKEYEKSRSLIMLRYGLYEFKTVPASRELLKKWKQENDVPDEDEEMADDSTLRSNGSFRASTKRRAEDDLSRDDAPRSFSSQNKRRAPDREPLAESAAPTSNAGATPFSKKSKRGPEEMDQDEENQPNKMLKSKPSATLSLFEEVANNTPAKRAASPVKPASKPLFGDATASKPQPSIFAQPPSQSGAAKPASSGGNIFGHLSKQNTPIASDDEDESEGGDSDEEVEEVPAPEKKAPSATPAFGSAGPSLFGNKASAPFGSSTPSGNLFGKGPSLMDRAAKESEAEADKTAEKQPTSPPKQSQPLDKTWNPNTPIKFGGATASASTPLFGASTTQAGSLFGKSSATTPATGSTQTKDFAAETPKASAPSLFGKIEKPSEGSSNLFGNATKTPLFGKPEQPKPSESTASTSLFGAKPLDANTTPFGKPAETPATEAQSTKSMFGGLSTPTPSTQPSAPSLFGVNNEKPATSIFGTNDKPSNSLFGATNGDKPSTSSGLFGAKSNVEEKKEESAAKRKKPDSDAAGEQPAPKFSFGGNAPTPADKLPPKTAAAANGATDAASVFGAPNVGEKKYTFGAPAAASTTVSSDAPAAAPVAAPTFSFGSTTASSEPAKTPAAPSLFGNTTSQPEPAKAQSSIFANAAPSAPSTGFTFGAQPSTTSADPPSNGLFGTSSTNANNSTSNANGGSIFGFGANPTPTPASSSFTFNSGGGDTAFNPAPVTFNPSQPPSFDFGASSGASGFQFGAGSTPAPAAPFSFGGAPTASSTSFSFGGASQPANDPPTNGIFSGGATNGGSSMFSFGAGSQEQSQPASGLFSGQPANAAQGIFANQLAAPPTTSGANTPLFGGASSVATTPATGTPEPEAAKNDSTNGKADDEDTPQDQQLSLAEGGPGEEEEEVVHEVRAKALRHVPVQPDDDEEVKAKKKATPWQTEGLGPLRVLKHKTTGAVRILLRTEPSGKVAMNKLVLPNFEYKVDKGVKWLKVTAAKDDGKGLETWMLQVKTNEFAVKLAAALEEHKMANKK